ncbi:MAG: hypothetical protein JNG85_06375 [Spirochaetaceae bacterium]|nr:hypothetical protein [Spirochaetaceae bacterium]
MRFRTRLQLLGVPLVLLPILATVVLSRGGAARTVEEAGRGLIATKLSLLENRVASSYEILSKVGLQLDEFFTRNALDGVAKTFTTALGPGEKFAVFSLDGEYLTGSLASGARALAPEDPLRAAFRSAEGTGSVASTFLSASGGRHIVAHRRFEPWSWILVTAIDEEVVYRSARDASAASLFLSAAFVAAAAVGFLVLATRISEPLVRLGAYARSLGEGRFEAPETPVLPAAGLGSTEEISVLAEEFAEMGSRIASLTRGLEDRVAERTAELERSNADLGLANAELSRTIAELRATQDQLIESEKMASIGHLVAGIAHELNTPIGALASAGRNAKAAMDTHLADILEFYRNYPEAGLPRLRGLLARALAPKPPRDTKEERALRAELLRSLMARGVEDADETADRLVELGVASGAEAEEFADFAAGAEGARAIDAAYQVTALDQSLAIMEIAADRAARIVKSLRIYSRQEADEEPRETDLREEIETILTIYRHVLKRGVEVVRDYEEVPTIPCRRDRLNQVWINLINNALQAMKYRGRLAIAVRRSGSGVLVAVTDSGSGIPEEYRARIFTPFFTTKASGEGTGLGLSIAKRIVEESGGGIDFTSEPGNTTFRVLLPSAPSRCPG